MSSSDSSGHHRHRKRHQHHHRHRRSRSREPSLLTNLVESLRKDLAKSHDSVRKELQSISDRVTTVERLQLPAVPPRTTASMEQSLPNEDQFETSASEEQSLHEKQPGTNPIEEQSLPTSQMRTGAPMSRVQPVNLERGLTNYQGSQGVRTSTAGFRPTTQSTGVRAHTITHPNEYSTGIRDNNQSNLPSNRAHSVLHHGSAHSAPLSLELEDPPWIQLTQRGILPMAETICQSSQTIDI